MTPRWPEDAQTIIEWADGGPVDLDRLICELEDWSNHLALTAALWDDCIVQRDHISTGGAA